MCLSRDVETNLRIGRVLVGSDLDAASAPAVTIGGAIAQAFGAPLVIVHATSTDMPAYFTGAEIPALESERATARARETAAARTFAAAYTTVPFDVLIDDAPPADMIVRIAMADDLVVVGTRRLHGAKRWWLGSVAEAVVRRSRAPVLVVPAPASGSVLRPGVRVVAPQVAGVVADAWIAAFERAWHAAVVRTGAIAACQPQELQTADLVIVPTLGNPETVRAVAHVLEDCTHPVLFVPARHEKVTG